MAIFSVQAYMGFLLVDMVARVNIATVEPLRSNVELLGVNVEPLRVNVEPLRVNVELLRVNVEPLRVNVAPLSLKVAPFILKLALLNTSGTINHHAILIFAPMVAIDRSYFLKVFANN